MIDTLEIYKLSDIAKMEGISYRTAQRRAENGKLIPVIIKDKKEKIRYFDSGKTKMILTKKEMKNVIANVFEYYDINNTDKYKMDFEKYLNDCGLNGNGGENEDKEEYYYEAKIESFL